MKHRRGCTKNGLFDCYSLRKLGAIQCFLKSPWQGLRETFNLQEGKRFHPEKTDTGAKVGASRVLRVSRSQDAVTMPLAAPMTAPTLSTTTLSMRAGWCFLYVLFAKRALHNIIVDKL